MVSPAPGTEGPLKAAIVGAGWMGRLHAECLGAAGAEIAGVVEPSRAELERFHARTAFRSFRSVRDLLHDCDASLIAICTPSGLHAEQAIECIESGRHVVVEKPIATRVADGVAMVEAAERAGVTLSVVLQYRFNRDALRLRRAVEAGLFGEVVFASVENYLHRDDTYFDTNGGWRGTWRLNGGGVLINQTTHGIDLLDWCLGPISTAAGTALTRRHQIEVEDTLCAVITFPSGTIGHVQATTAGASNSALRLELVGTRGAAVFERSRLTRWEPAEDLELLTAAELEALPPAPSDAFGEAFGAAHARQYVAIIDALRDGRQPPVSGEEALGSLRTIEQIYSSIAFEHPQAQPVVGVR
jgi:UDP-N-acetyl-2-amino-2-deoxyglucuronate dehydrogenase